MEIEKLRSIIQNVILCRFAEKGERFVPVASSNRHIHLCRCDVDALFSPGYQLTKLRDLSQTGQYACNEIVFIETSKGKLSLRVLGPVRPETQVELSIADTVSLGMPTDIRMSGDIFGTPGAKLICGNNTVVLTHGVIVARRHLHISLDEAAAFGVKDGDLVSLECGGERPTVLRDVIVRADKSFSLEAHIDRDEANAMSLNDGMLCKLVLPESADSVAQEPTREHVASEKPPYPERVWIPAPPGGASDVVMERVTGAAAVTVNSNQTHGHIAPEAHNVWGEVSARHCQAERAVVGAAKISADKLVTEEDVKAAKKAGTAIIECAKGTIITPLARDAARECGIIFSKYNL